MPRPKPVYACSKCGQVVGRERLRTKAAVFKHVGKGGPSIRTRTVAWLCTPGCLEEDDDWKRVPYATSPGNEGIKT